MLLPATLTLVAYLLGSIPFGFLLIKYVFTKGEDVRSIGSGATGATNVARRAGLGAGILTYLLDCAKGLAAVLLMQRVADDNIWWLGAAGLAVIAGHIFPIFLGFRGGKGVATGVGAFLVLAPYSVVAALGVWAITILFTRYVSLASIVATASLPVWTLIHSRLFPIDRSSLLALVLVEFLGAALIVAKHHENISRLLRGVEPKAGTRVGSASAR